jgi:hypothetical protein
VLTFFRFGGSVTAAFGSGGVMVAIGSPTGGDRL